MHPATLHGIEMITKLYYVIFAAFKDAAVKYNRYRAFIILGPTKGSHYIKWYTGIRLPPKCMTLNDL